MAGVVATITPAIRSVCRRELTKVCDGDAKYGTELEDAIWKWSKGLVPSAPHNVLKEKEKAKVTTRKRKRGKKEVEVEVENKNETEKEEEEETVIVFNSNVLYEGKFKQLQHNLSFNATHLCGTHTPYVLIWLDDFHLAQTTPFQSIQSEANSHTNYLKKILTSSEMVETKQSADLALGLAKQTTFLKCRRCKSGNIKFGQKQTRSGDEGMTSFCSCQDCGTTWKM